MKNVTTISMNFTYYNSAIHTENQKNIIKKKQKQNYLTDLDSVKSKSYLPFWTSRRI